MHIFGLSQGKAADLDNGNFNHNMAAYFKHVSRSVVTDTSLKKESLTCKNRHRIRATPFLHKEKTPQILYCQGLVGTE